MRLLLLHNPTAGDRHLRRGELLALVEDAGWQARYCSTDEPGWERMLDEVAEDLVVVAGGDGTVRKVATRLRDETLPLAILPLGTANNLARSLGVTHTPAELVAGFATAGRRPLDVGVARVPWGKRRFVEAVGVGLFARMIGELRNAPAAGAPRADAPSLDPEMARGLRTLLQLLPRASAHSWRVRLDEKELDGDYLLLEAMNIPLIGPHLALAPAADPGDGLLDVVMVREADRERFAEYLRARLEGPQEPPSLPVHRGRRLQVYWDGAPLHRDDRLWPARDRARRRRWRAARRELQRLQVRLGRTLQVLSLTT